MVLSSCVTVDGWLTTFRISQKPIVSFLRQLTKTKTKTKTNPKISFGFWFGSMVSNGLQCKNMCATYIPVGIPMMGMIKIQINRVHAFTYKNICATYWYYLLPGTRVGVVPGSTIDDTIDSCTWYQYSHKSRLEHAYLSCLLNCRLLQQICTHTHVRLSYSCNTHSD